jgi:hypothetical protein
MGGTCWQWHPTRAIPEAINWDRPLATPKDLTLFRGDDFVAGISWFKLGMAARKIKTDAVFLESCHSPFKVLWMATKSNGQSSFRFRGFPDMTWKKHK